jgi:hypothetical protein
MTQNELVICQCGHTDIEHYCNGKCKRCSCEDYKSLTQPVQLGDSFNIVKPLFQPVQNRTLSDHNTNPETGTYYEQLVQDKPTEDLLLDKNEMHLINNEMPETAKYGEVFESIAKAQLAKCQPVIDKLEAENKELREREAQETELANKWFNSYQELRALLKCGDESIREDEREKVFAVCDKYITLLNEELSEIVQLAASHGWKSTRYEKGIECIKAIAQLKGKGKGE